MKALPDTAAFAFKSRHYEELEANSAVCDWVEVHPENYMQTSGVRLAQLEQVRNNAALSLHGVGMSLASGQSLDESHLKQLKQMVDRFQPHSVSEHLAWSHWNSVYYNDLLPIPYTKESLQQMCLHVERVQEVLCRPILIENPSLLVRYRGNEYSEGEFLGELVTRTGCGLLFDLNNLYVSSINLSDNAFEQLADYPLKSVGEVHLAGHSVEQLEDGTELRIDDHGSEVCDPVWELYRAFLQLTGCRVPTLIEWDTDTPGLDVLTTEMDRAEQIMATALAGGEAA